MATTRERSSSILPLEELELELLEELELLLDEELLEDELLEELELEEELLELLEEPVWLPPQAAAVHSTSAIPLQRKREIDELIVMVFYCLM